MSLRGAHGETATTSGRSREFVRVHGPSPTRRGDVASATTRRGRPASLEGDRKRSSSSFVKRGALQSAHLGHRHPPEDDGAVRARPDRSAPGEDDAERDAGRAADEVVARRERRVVVTDPPRGTFDSTPTGSNGARASEPAGRRHVAASAAVCPGRTRRTWNS
jgi:hypothetical protein